MIPIGQIIEGHGNKVLDKLGLLPADLKALSDQRFNQCTTCHTDPRPDNPSQTGPGLRNNQYCNSCGCDMLAKTKVIAAKCPIGRW
ncbi:MAG: hypothetical protein ACK5WO_00145 [Cyclobacteriaceae bacterium]|jgi:hypothetical protein|nr:hypothetical protein [Flammeovirgaceae bacterium]